MELRRRVVWVTTVGVLAAGAYLGGLWVRQHGWALPSAAWAQQEAGPKLVAVAKRIGAGADEKGEVLISDRTLFTVDTSAGGLTGYERAMIIAKRLNDAFAAGAVPEDFRASVAQGMNVVLWRNTPLVTVDDAQARALGKERAQVAEEWAAAIRQGMREALGLPPVPPELGQAQPGATPQGQAAQPTSQGAPPAGAQPQAAEPAKEEAEWTPPEPYDEKIVPIVSVGKGMEIGAAQVKGPRSRVQLVQACAALEARYKDVLDVEIYVPISTKKPGKKLDRIQGVGVVAVGKYKLTGH
ncbi:MAG: hypothetical protein H5T86_06525 [Armatimonadetes bacterium]|nr:hypothetical protein [Armatimonadota bacterium]